MRTLRSLIYGEVLSAVAFVTLGFAALFFFFDFVEELRWIGNGSDSPLGAYNVSHALLYVSLLQPSHLYELLPITVLIGTIYVLARMAQSSEFTILRTSGLGPWRALRTLLWLGLAFAVLTFAMGDYVAPYADKNAQLFKAQFKGRLSTGATGAWLKEKQPGREFAVNVAAITAQGQLQDVRIYEFDDQGYLRGVMRASVVRFAPEDGGWRLQGVERQAFEVRQADRGNIALQSHEDWLWKTEISPAMVTTALLKPDRMSTLDLFRYIRHLDANAQSAQIYEIEFWRKVFYPLSCLVMVVLALPFAYLHFRRAGITAYVFTGVMIGISFFLLNNVFGYLGNLSLWWPWLTAAAPGLIYSLLSLGAFTWLVLRQ